MIRFDTLQESQQRMKWKLLFSH